MTFLDTPGQESGVPSTLRAARACMPAGVSLISHITLQLDNYGSRNDNKNYGLPRMADHVLDALLSALPSTGEDPTEHKRLR